MGRSCTSARQLVSTLVWVRWSTTLYFKWNQKVRNFIQWIPSGRHESFSLNLELQKKFQFTKGGADRQLNLWIYPPPRPWRDWPPSHCPAFALFPRSYSLTIFIISKLLFLLIYHVQRVLEDVHPLTWYKLFRYWTRALLCSSNEMCSGKKKRGTHKWRI